MSKKARSALFGFVLFSLVLSLGTIACDWDDVEDAFVEEPGRILNEVVDSTQTQGKNTGFVGGAGKLLCESTGGRWVASIDACYKK